MSLSPPAGTPSVSQGSETDEKEKKKDNQKPIGSLSFRFCRNCSNMLYPQEDSTNNTLRYACRTCHSTELADSPCVYRDNLVNTTSETAGVTQDVASDPTVSLPDFCTLCGDCITCSTCGLSMSKDVAAVTDGEEWREYQYGFEGGSGESEDSISSTCSS